MNKKISEFLKSFLVWFAIFYLGMWAYSSFFGKKEVVASQEMITIAPERGSLTLGNLARFKIVNDSQELIRFISPCEKPGSLVISRLVNNQKVVVSGSSFENCEQKKVESVELSPGTSRFFSLKDFSAQIFTESGSYSLSMKFEAASGVKIIESESIEYENPGAFRRLFRAIVSKPLFNLLVFFIEKSPNHSLGLSIIILTILVRLALFFPNQKAMKSQRRLQQLQPKIEALRAKYGKNQQALALKTMELYKTEKINPMSSCLPMLFQMPFLLGIYFVVKDGLSEHLRFLLYPFNQNVDLAMVNSDFLWLNLEVPDIMILPLLVGGSQFLAVKLSMVAAKKTTIKKAPAEGMAGQMEQMQKIMLYVLPVMLGVFTATFPAAVGIYWLTSTLFGIFQQKLVNWQLERMPEVRRKN
ncbi:membrane protein insertase YidC [Candidatus Gracilibacteria bacterium]|nr:membrane protein insertase YidC [Candidatus Gracilibacteria bacterium]